MTAPEIGMWVTSVVAIAAQVWNRFDLHKIKLSVNGLRVEWGKGEKESSYKKGVAGDVIGEAEDSDNLK